MSVTPETARQAVKRWTRARNGRDLGMCDSGDDLAKLVPQLLDRHEEALQLYDAAMIAAGHDIDALETKKAQLLDQSEFITEIDAALGLEEYPIEELPARVGALGERVHQLETALRQIEGWDTVYRSGAGGLTWREIARAALLPEPPRAHPDGTGMTFDCSTCDNTVMLPHTDDKEHLLLAPMDGWAVTPARGLQCPRCALLPEPQPTPLLTDEEADDRATRQQARQRDWVSGSEPQPEESA